MNTIATKSAQPAATRGRLMPESRVWLAACTALVAAGVFLRCWHLGNIPGINGDEAWSGVQAVTLLSGEPLAWRTPSGNPINWFFLLPMAALHALLPPSFELLRVTPLASGLAALVLNYAFCGRAFDRRTAVISTVLLALFPVNIAYSRFAWDASQTLLVIVLVLYLPLLAWRADAERGWPTSWAMVALAASMLVHPTNVFAAPLVFAYPLWRRRGQIAPRVRNLVLPAKTPALAAVAVLGAGAAYAAWMWLSGRTPLHAPAELGVFARRYLQLLSGTTIYEFISGAGLPAEGPRWALYVSWLSDTLLAALATVAMLGLYRRMARGASAVDEAAVVGWFAMLALFFLVAGPGAISPHFERYGICLVAPAALVLSRGLAWWVESWQPHRRAATVALAAAAWLWPLCFYLNYFEFMIETGGRSHATFRTAAVEPKQAALRYIVEHRPKGEPVRIVCRDWWNYWPIAYLASDMGDVGVWTWRAGRCAQAVEINPWSEKTWLVEFVDDARGARPCGKRRQWAPMTRRKTILDYAERPLIDVAGPPENLSQNY